MVVVVEVESVLVGMVVVVVAFVAEEVVCVAVRLLAVGSGWYSLVTAVVGLEIAAVAGGGEGLSISSGLVSS